MDSGYLLWKLSLFLIKGGTSGIFVDRLVLFSAAGHLFMEYTGNTGGVDSEKLHDDSKHFTSSKQGLSYRRRSSSLFYSHACMYLTTVP